MDNRDNRPFYVRTSSYSLSRTNAIFFLVLMVVAAVIGIVATLTSGFSRALPFVGVFGMAVLLAAQNAATAAWLTRKDAVRSAAADRLDDQLNGGHR